MHEWLNQILAFVDAASTGRAICASLIAGVMATQWFKFLFPIWLNDKNHTLAVRILATFITTFIFLLMAPPEKLPTTMAIAILVGLSSPTIYWLTVKVLYHYFPWTEDMLSARPTPDDNKEHS
jgi:hypothetical protein